MEQEQTPKQVQPEDTETIQIEERDAKREFNMLVRNLGHRSWARHRMWLGQHGQATCSQHASACAICSDPSRKQPCTVATFVIALCVPSFIL